MTAMRGAGTELREMGDMVINRASFLNMAKTLRRMATPAALLSVVCVFSSAPMVWADDLGCSARKGARHGVAEVIDGVTMRLDDGRVVRLAGLLPPSPPLDVAPGAPWPIAETSKRHLAGLIAGEDVAVSVALGESRSAWAP